MKDELRDQIWKRDKGSCQECGKSLVKVIDVYEQILEQFSDLKEINIYKWLKSCWKCAKETPIVTYDFSLGVSYHIGDISQLDRILMTKYPFVQKVFSKTMGSEVIANVCVNCNSLQGNFFIVEDLIDLGCVNSSDMDKYVDIKLPNDLKIEEFVMKEECGTYQEKKSSGHIHHKDRNRDNNSVENLILLCRECHIKTHSELRRQKCSHEKQI